MLLFDLKWFIFSLLTLLTLVTIAIVWLGWIYQKRSNNIFFSHGKELQNVLEQAPFGWLAIDAPGQYRYANAYTRHLLGLTSPAGVLPDAIWVTLLEEDCTATEPTGASSGRYRRVVLPSEQIIQWWIFPLNELNVAFILDVTEQYRAKESGRQLLSNLSHELRTPLASILTHLEILSTPDMPEETVQQSLQLLKQEGQRMSRLVNQMLDLGRIESDEGVDRRYVDLLAIAEEAIAQVSPLATSKNTNILLDAATPLPPVLGDDSRLKQVFLNLLDNAIKHTPSGTQVVLSLQPERGGIACSVSDDGPGIPAEHLPYVARRFYRAAPQKVEGSGLGLALVTEILRRHQSRLVIESHTDGEEKGVQARFILPCPPEQEQAQ